MITKTTADTATAAEIPGVHAPAASALALASELVEEPLIGTVELDDARALALAGVISCVRLLELKDTRAADGLELELPAKPCERLGILVGLGVA